MTTIDPTKTDADLLREIARNVEAATPGFPTEYQGKLRTWARRLNALLHAPAPRTLADMSPEERKACQWAQAEVLENEHWHGGVGVITFIREHGVMPWACVMDSDGSQWDEVPFRYIVPLPDLPRMVWPDGHHPATDTEETPEPAQPRPEDVPAGEQDMEEQTAVVDRGWIYHGDTERTHLPDGTTVRRFVTDWEEA